MAGMERIEHIIILMMENRSFDHYLGALNLEGRNDVDGLNATSGTGGPFQTGVQPWCIDDLNMDFFDPPHEWPEVRKQWNGGKMDGFASTYLAFHKDKHPNSAVHLEEMSHVVMGYYTRKTLPVLYALADQFTVCDHWHSSFPGSTHPNRAITFAGDCGNVLTTTWKNAFKSKPDPFWRTWQNTISWKVYKWRPHDLSTFSIWSGFLKSGDPHLRTIKDFASDCQKGKLPNVSIIEPSYQVADDHPPHDPRRGQQFIGHVVKTLTRSKSWLNSVLVLTYDEHGGFFDHVPPSTRPGGNTSPLDILGFRVPTLIVSPYAQPGRAVSVPFEHTSILKSIADRWRLPIPKEMGPRVAASPSIWDSCLDFAPGRDLIATVNLPTLDDADWTARLHPVTGTPVITDLHETLTHLDHLEALNELDPGH